MEPAVVAWSRMGSRARFFVRQAVSAMARAPGITALAILTIAVSLAVLAAFSVIVSDLRQGVEQLGEEVVLSAYLARGSEPSSMVALASRVQSWAEVEKVDILSSEDAFLAFRASLGSEENLLEGLPADVVPPSLEIRLVGQDWTTREVQQLANRVTGLEGVEDVQFGQDDLERVGRLLRFVRIGAFGLGMALCLATIVIVYNTIRLTLYARRGEIEILTLVGATGGFVRAPFVIEGALQGVIGGLLAGALLAGLSQGLQSALEQTIQFATLELSFQFFTLTILFGLTVAGGMLGVTGSLLAVGRFLRL